MKKYLGLEFGSTRIKGVLIDENHSIIASGGFTWENQLRNGVWTYPLEDAHKGLRTCYAELKAEYEKKFGEPLVHIDAIGISGMMHGYLAFDKDGNQLAEFRTWRNTITEPSSVKLTKLFGFHVPQRWSVAHVYQAILNREPETPHIDFMTTLAGYFHYLLTGERVIGIGEASGMFPVDEQGKNYDHRMLGLFNALVREDVPWLLEEIFPRVLVAGEFAGHLTEKGRDLLDESKQLEVGIPFCPPEGDMGTGMVCTNSVAVGTGNASIGTSSNVTIVTGSRIGVHPEIDVILTPTGESAALVHVNNGTSGINSWERLFKEIASHFNESVTDGDIYTWMFQSALSGDVESKGIYPVDYFSGEPITHVNEGKLLLLRDPDVKMSVANFVRAHIYSLLGTIRIGVDILRDTEGVVVRKIVGHGGFFKTPNVGELMLSSALNVPVVTLQSAGEGGPYGQAILAAYLMEKEEGELLEEYLEKRVFSSQKANQLQAKPEEVAGFNVFMEHYKDALKVERAALNVRKEKPSLGLEELKKAVYEANLRLVKEELVTLTWGNVSGIDRVRGLVVIKPSGVPYESMKAEDMVVVDLEGNVVEGHYRPSSDLPTHLELYRAFPQIGGIVHTHSTFAVAFAQAKRPIPCLGTTHADTFHGPIPCTRDLKGHEIADDYERNTGKVIVQTFDSLDPVATPGVLLPSHGPFAWGADPKEAVDHAVVLERVAKLAHLTLTLNAEQASIDPQLEQKHYERKHGKNAYYGQKEKK